LISVIFNGGWMLHSELHNRNKAVSHEVKRVTSSNCCCLT